MTYPIRPVETSLPIEQGVEMPELKTGRPSGHRGHKCDTWPFRFMEIGDSVLDPDATVTSSKAYRAAKAYQTFRKKAVEFAARSMPATDTHPAGLRIWRIK